MGYIAGGTFGGAWTSYTSTLTGFSALPASVLAEYVRLGPKTFGFKWDMTSLGGTSNAASFTMTMPLIAKAQNRFIVMGLTTGTVYTAFECYTAAGSNILTFYTLAGGNPASSGTKGSWGGGLLIEEQ